MKRRYLVLLILTMIILPSKTKAECDNSRVSLMQQYSKDVTYNYTYNETNNGVTFDITFTNLKGVLSIKRPNDNNSYSNFNEVTIKNLKPNEEYTFEIYSSSLCPSTALKTLYIKMPGYNKYYKEKICEGIEDFKYCQKWINLPFDYERLQNEVTKYRKTLKNEETKKTTSKEDAFTKFKKMISKVFSKEYLVILSIIITAGVIIMVLRDRKSDLN